MRDRLNKMMEMGWPIWAIVIVSAMLCGTYMAFDTPGARFVSSVFKAVAITFMLFLVVSALKVAVSAARKRD